MPLPTPPVGTSWKAACADLWGERWVPSLADVLCIASRTVERWKSGDVEIPASLASDIVQLAASTTAPRVYGEMLRQVSCGRDLDTLTHILAKMREDDPLSRLQSKLRPHVFVSRRSREDVQTAAPAL